MDLSNSQSLLYYKHKYANTLILQDSSVRSMDLSNSQSLLYYKHKYANTLILQDSSVRSMDLSNSQSLLYLSLIHISEPTRRA